jgi:hypothetical protein
MVEPPKRQALSLVTMISSRFGPAFLQGFKGQQLGHHLGDAGGRQGLIGVFAYRMLPFLLHQERLPWLPHQRASGSGFVSFPRFPEIIPPGRAKLKAINQGQGDLAYFWQHGLPPVRLDFPRPV